MHTIAVTSGKGGVGKTSMSVNLGCALSALGKRVVLFDADLQLANIDIALGIQAEFSLQHVIAGDKSLNEILVDGPQGIRVVTGGSAVTTLMHAGPKRLAAFMSQIDDLAATTDYLIFDTAAGLDNRVFAFLKRADEVLVVVTPEPTSVTDAYATIKVLQRRKPEAEIRILVNRAPSESVAKATFRALKSTVQNFLDIDVLSAGYVLRDDIFEKSTLMRKVAFCEFNDSSAIKSLSRIAEELTVHSKPVVLYESA